MVDISKFNSMNVAKSLKSNGFQAGPNFKTGDVSIFANTTSHADENVEALQTQLDEVEGKQGLFSNLWNGVKEHTGIGTSVDKCDEAIEKYKNGEITFEEASEIIDNFEAKQDSSLNLFSNIATSVVAIASVAAIAATGGAATPIAAAALGAATGAATKAGFKFADRATNKVDGDALDAKQIVRDGLSGAVTGSIAVATAGTGEGAFKAAGESAKLSTHIAKGAAKSAITGVKTGSISGASNYLIDCAFDDDKDFNVKDLAGTTIENAAWGGAVGTFMGGLTGSLRHTGVLTASNSDVVANSVSTTSYKIVNDRMRSIAA